MAYLLESEKPDFSKMHDRLIPAVIQDADTAQVLMLGFMNAEALEVTQNSGLVTFYSRSKQRLWTKGESSGNTMAVKQILLDCDQDTLLIKAIPNGPICHTGADTCWGEQRPPASFLPELENIIEQRKNNPVEGSYTARLMASGIPKIAQKVGEEAVETVIEALGASRDLFLNETADLLYHLMVLLSAKNVTLKEVEAVLKSRHSSGMPV